MSWRQTCKAWLIVAGRFRKLFTCWTWWGITLLGCYKIFFCAFVLYWSYCV